jgi:hypothetical protein
MKPDPEYIAKRDALIPQAEKYANRLYGAVGKGKTAKEREEWANLWSRAFHMKMNELVKGLK